MITMDGIYEEELKRNLRKCVENGELKDRKVYLFGHCSTTLALADLLFENGIKPVAIMDNNDIKHGILYKGIPVQKPDLILKEDSEKAVVLIVTRFYEAMNVQLRKLGFTGTVRKLVDYNTYAEYSLSEEVFLRKQERLHHGEQILASLRNKYPEHFLVFCPFQALGDIYVCMSYLPDFLKRRGVDRCTICVGGKGCSAVVSLFGDYPVEIFEQKKLDAVVQACLYENRKDTFIAHQDRPYVVDLNRALYLKKIPFEKIYCCGVFNLPIETEPIYPVNWEEFPEKNRVKKEKSVILSPYAKSVTALSGNIWKKIIESYKEKNYQIFTNVVGDEKPLEGTESIRPKLSEIKSLVEHAGTFIGIRSGLCDVIRTADCRKIALYPDYQYCDTKWRSIDMYFIDGFENIAVKEGVKWEKN